MKIDIIGAGIGGLTAAIALYKKGFDVRLFEQAKSIQPIGAGILLAHNAMQVYEKLGHRQEIENAGNPITSINLTDAKLKPLSSVDMSPFDEKFKVKNIAIHRGVLQKILIDNLPTSELHLGHQLEKLQKSNQGFSLEFQNGKKVESEILVGADGIHSELRKSLFPKSYIRNARQVCWRGVTDFTLEPRYLNMLTEAWGKTGRFGFVQISPNQVYWYALKSYQKSPDELVLSEIGNYFSDFDPVVNRIMTSTPTAQINTAEIEDLSPIHQWHQDRACLLGDAAHAATPNMGQGACQAIEDAYVLAHCLSKYNVPSAFEEYQKHRIKKATQVVRDSWRIGKMAHISNPELVTLRNVIIRLLPPSLNTKRTEKLFALEKTF